jgi:hypothetical protein
MRRLSLFGCLRLAGSVIANLLNRSGIEHFGHLAGKVASRFALLLSDQEEDGAFML